MTATAKGIQARGDRLAAKARAANAVGVPGMSMGFGDLVAEEAARSLSWLKVPAQKALEFTILSADAVRYMIHWDPASKPYYCVGLENGCAYCVQRRKAEARYAMCVFEEVTRSRAMVEFGAATCLPIFEQKRQIGTCRGITLRLTKEGGRYKGRILVEFVRPFVTEDKLPPEVAVAPHLCRQYGLTLPE